VIAGQDNDGENGFDFSDHISRLCQDITSNCPAFYHIDPQACMFTVTPSRSQRRHGLLARVTPLRFPDGQRYRRRNGSLYQVQRYFVEEQELLYVVTFCLPRFLNLPFEEKLVTVFHELFHISPYFNGDIRRHDGRCSKHSQSKREYDEAMRELVRQYLNSHNRPAVLGFLHSTAAQLTASYGGITGVIVPRPLVVPVRRIGTLKV